MPATLLTPNRKFPLQFGAKDNSEGRARKLNEEMRALQQRITRLETLIQKLNSAIEEMQNAR